MVSIGVNKEFLAEAEEIIEKLNLDLLALGESADCGVYDPELLNGIFRGAHSLKGLSGMFGLDDISALAHRLENLLDSLRLGKISPEDSLIAVLFEGLDGLTRLVHGKGESSDFTFDLNPLFDRLDKALGNDEDKKPDLATQLGIDPEVLKVLTEYEEHRLFDNFRRKKNILRVKAVFSIMSFDQELAEINDVLKGRGEVISTLPCAGEDAEKIAFQILLGTSDTARDLSAILDRDRVQVELLGGGQLTPDTAENTRTDEPPPSEVSDGGSLRSISQTVRVDIEKLDSLMNIVGELVLSKGAISAFAEKLKSDGDSERSSDLQKATRTLERRLEELQKGVMEVRMVPVSQLFDKMARIVRRVSSEHGKKVTLDIRGGETELDKLIMENLSDPLMHIIRNAIDHGIESAAERLASGKAEKGTICLWAAQKGNHVVIEVRDDGKGIDPERVRRKAVEKGLISEQVELSRQDIFDLLFTAGFSTKDQVSDLSGRGVGMDVVKNNISELSGMIEMDSRVGQGTAISITLPITLAIIKALIIRVCGKTYAIPINSVLETLMVEDSSVRTIEKREVIDLRQSTLPLVRLGRVFNLPEMPNKSGRFFVAVVGLAEKRMGIVVDELLGQQDVVIKSLGSTLSFVRGIAGAADLGNQRTILVLDVGGLMSEAVKGESMLHV